MPFFEMKWEPRDLWVGVFWDRKITYYGTREFHLYVCPLPTVLFHWTFSKEAE